MAGEGNGTEVLKKKLQHRGSIYTELKTILLNSHHDDPTNEIPRN